ncbi:hypothetical protein [Nocardioides coralli]|uniref:hypothetical protein n=1 Tax=Nocardioides coralli TaxID=2872154 RepID=UPI001CA434EF|nr:hypothetical protein [Nocardioides coralli]QZY27859.1 hypothetical protein K6T13_10095 [Nocardioides coralli]
MRSTYRFLANSIAVLVVVQAGAIAWAFFGLSNWIRNDNGVVDKAFMESGDSFGVAEWGFIIHAGIIGLLVIPLLALVMLIVSFFAKVPGGVMLAVTVFVLVALQVVVLPALAREVGSGFGALHGINALVLMGAALGAGKRAASVKVDSPGTTATLPG